MKGGDNGIGLGIAHALCEAGMSVVVCGIVDETLEKAGSELCAVGAAEAVRLDVRDRDGFAALADRMGGRRAHLRLHRPQRPVGA
jgi:NADP-dependent 3-hydroxy acid dehydrogenase YdfG